MKALITGGAGFIGANTVDRLKATGNQVAVIDNLWRKGSAENLEWLRRKHGDFPFYQVDVRDFEGLKGAFAEHKEFDTLLHFAAQVAVTSSVSDPRTDFEVNALGTLNVLEAVRELQMDPVILYTSTNKVYGALPQVELVEEDKRYRYKDLPGGIPETMPMDFYSPYGCSKGAADQYMRDYHRIYGLKTIVFRNSCIYGPRQFGIEDQGWLAWFVIAALHGRPITIYGDGKQVRDVLYIDDLVDAMFMAIEKVEVTQGRIYNMGGGPDNSLAVWREFGPLLGELLGREIPVSYDEWRPGDQPVYISDISKAQQEFEWEPSTSVRQGARFLVDWVKANRDLFA